MNLSTLKNYKLIQEKYLDDFKSNIFDYLDKSAFGEYLVVLDECKQLFDSMQSYKKEYDERIKELQDAGTLIAGKNSTTFSVDELLSWFKTRTAVAFLKITNSEDWV